MPDRVLRLGVVGLSRGFDLTRPTLAGDPRVRLIAAADPRPEARAAFQMEFGGNAYETAESLYADPEVEVVYVAAPHGTHADLALRAAAAGKHLIVEKPMALDLAACAGMIEAAHAAGVTLIVGPSHGFDPPVALAAEIIASGEVGPVRLINMLTFTDFLYRPRRPEELVTAQGGGVVFSQAAHQVDVVRRLAGAPVATVRALVGRWDPTRPTEGAYQALLTFEGGASATLTYSGYGRFDTDALMEGIGETGRPKDAPYGAARRRLAEGGELSLKAGRAYRSATPPQPPPGAHEHFGFVLVVCERGDLRLTPSGVEVYGLESRRFAPCAPPRFGREALVDELWGAVVEGRTPLHSGAWGRENLATCLAILRSAAEGREVALAELEDRP